MSYQPNPNDTCPFPLKEHVNKGEVRTCDEYYSVDADARGLYLEVTKGGFSSKKELIALGIR